MIINFQLYVSVKYFYGWNLRSNNLGFFSNILFHFVFHFFFLFLFHLIVFLGFRPMLFILTFFPFMLWTSWSFLSMSLFTRLFLNLLLKCSLLNLSQIFWSFNFFLHNKSFLLNTNLNLLWLDFFSILFDLSNLISEINHYLIMFLDYLRINTFPLLFSLFSNFNELLHL